MSHLSRVGVSSFFRQGKLGCLLDPLLIIQLIGIEGVGCGFSFGCCCCFRSRNGSGGAFLDLGILCLRGGEGEGRFYVMASGGVVRWYGGKEVGRQAGR